MSICVSLASLIRDPLYNVHLNKFQVALSYSGLNFNFWSLAETRLMKHTTRLFGSLCCSSKPLQIWLEIRIPAERQWRQSQKCLDTMHILEFENSFCNRFSLNSKAFIFKARIDAMCIETFNWKLFGPKLWGCNLHNLSLDVLYQYLDAKEISR